MPSGGSYECGAGEYDPVPARILYPNTQIGANRAPVQESWGILMRECYVLELTGVTREQWIQNSQQVVGRSIFRIPRLDGLTDRITEQMLLHWRRMVFQIEGIGRPNLQQLELRCIASNILESSLPPE